MVKILVAPPSRRLLVPHAWAGSYSRQHIRVYAHSEGLGPGSFIVLSCSGDKTGIGKVGTHTHPPHPNQHRHPLHTTSTPTSPMWKSLKSASMSRQRRRMALSASSDVAGTWKRFSAASSLAMCSPITPLHCHTIPFTPEAQQV